MTQGTDERWRHWCNWRKALALLGVVLLCLVASAPRLLSLPWLHQSFLDRVTAHVGGRMSADEVRLRWLAPPRLHGLRWESADGQSLLTLDACRGDVPLWRWWFQTNWGRFEVEQPHVYWTVYSDDNNWTRTVSAIPRDADTHRDSLSASSLIDSLQATLAISKGQLTFENAGLSHEPWTVGELHIELGVQPTERGAPRVTVQPGALLERVEITPRIVDDLLKFVAPSLADAAQASGSFSIETGGAVVPLDDPAAGYAFGRLTIHEVQAGPGALVAQWAREFGLPLSTQVMQDCEIDFELVDRGVLHRGLQLRMGPLRVETEGRVGLDESLDLLAVFRWPAALQVSEEEPDRVVRVPVRGTLSQPRVDWSQWWQHNPQLGGRVADWLEEGLPAIRQQLQERRAQRDAERGQGPSDSTSHPPRNRLLPRLIDRLRRPREPEPDRSDDEPRESQEGMLHF